PLAPLKTGPGWAQKNHLHSLAGNGKKYCNAQEAFFKQKPKGRKPPKFKSRHYYMQSATIKNVHYRYKLKKDNTVQEGDQIYVVDPHTLQVGKKLLLHTSSLKCLKGCTIKRMMIKYRQDLDRFYLS